MPLLTVIKGGVWSQRVLSNSTPNIISKTIGRGGPPVVARPICFSYSAKGRTVYRISQQRAAILVGDVDSKNDARQRLGNWAELLFQFL